MKEEVVVSKDGMGRKSMEGRKKGKTANRWE